MPSTSAKPYRVLPERLSASDFLPFGYVIEDPAGTDATMRGTSANQGSAVKYSDVSYLENEYRYASNVRDARPSISLFHCSPRTIVESKGNEPRDLLPLTVLERHPYTTQTFIPLGVPANDDSRSYLVVVARSKATTGSKHDLPDLENVRVFTAQGSQAVTYGCGVWHAPMIVLGKKPISFVVLQNLNGVPRDDCNECDIRNLGFRIDIELPRLNKSRTRL